MSDEKFEEFLRAAARGYNTPPARTPREDMWSAIQAKRSAGPRVVYGGATNIRREENRFGSRVWWAAAAGLVLVASGIGIGRWTANGNAPVQTAVAPSAPQPTSQSADPTSPTPLAQPNGPASVEGPSPQATPFPQSDSRVATIQRERPGASGVASSAPSPTRTTTDRSPRTVGTGSRGSAPTSAYELAEVNHLSAAEALLTSFRTRSPADQQQDARLAAWARELLSNTRLLLDSPVAEDPQRRPLLQDLELLLVQIVQLAPGSTPQDREIMDNTLKQDQLMTRLRTAIPAGQRGS